MSVRYVGVQWNRLKLVYDAAIALFVLAFVQLFDWLSGTVLRGDRAISPEIRHMRAWGACAFVMLSAILAIGPLARLDRRFAPLLYNRRHLGIAMCGVGVMHAYYVLGFYFAYGDLPQSVAALTYDTEVTAWSLPFVLFGVGALVIIVLMAATSHDFFQKLLGHSWKWLHTSVYVAYALVVLHVAFGALQTETSPAFTVGFLACVAGVTALHLIAARRSNALESRPARTTHEDDTVWLDAGPIDSLPEGRARPLATPSGERIALVKHEGRVRAVHGVCAHQGGPLYEGRVIDGCLTCPWHGWQYEPKTGCAPAPFTEKLPVYRVRTKDGRVLVDPRPLPAGTPLDGGAAEATSAEVAHG